MSSKPEQDKIPPGTICWHECMTRDGAAAKSFYTALFGWTTSEMPMGDSGNYTMFHPGQGQEALGGFMEMDGPQFEGVPPHWLTYFAVDDVDVAAAKVTELGGTVVVPPTAIPNVGQFAVIADPTGAVIALFHGGGG